MLAPGHHGRHRAVSSDRHPVDARPISCSASVADNWPSFTDDLTSSSPRPFRPYVAGSSIVLAVHLRTPQYFLPTLLTRPLGRIRMHA